MTVLIYVDTSKRVGDPDRLKVLATRMPRKRGLRKMTPKALPLSTRFSNEPHWPQDRLRHAGDTGAGYRLPGPGVALGSLYRITACQACALARIYSHCAIPVRPNSRIPAPVRRVCRLAPKVGTLAPRSLLCSVRALFLRVGARPHLQGCWGLIGGAVLDQLGNWPPDSSPHEAASSSLRLPHKAKAMQFPDRRQASNASAVRDPYSAAAIVERAGRRPLSNNAYGCLTPSAMLLSKRCSSLVALVVTAAKLLLVQIVFFQGFGLKEGP